MNDSLPKDLALRLVWGAHIVTGPLHMSLAKPLAERPPEGFTLVLPGEAFARLPRTTMTDFRLSYVHRIPGCAGHPPTDEEKKKWGKELGALIPWEKGGPAPEKVLASDKVSDEVILVMDWAKVEMKHVADLVAELDALLRLREA